MSNRRAQWGPWFAITSHRSIAGTYRIVADGATPELALSNAVRVLTAGVGSQLVGLEQFAQVHAQHQLDHLEVMSRSRALGLVGAAGLDQYNGCGSGTPAGADRIGPGRF